MNRISILAAAGDAAGILGGAIDLASRMAARLHRRCNRRRTRITLGDLDDRILRDIGLTRGDVLASRFRPGGAE